MGDMQLVADLFQRPDPSVSHAEPELNGELRGYRGSFLFSYGDPEQIRTADLRLDRAACWTATPRGRDVTFPSHTIVYVNTGPVDRQQR